MFGNYFGGNRNAISENVENNLKMHIAALTQPFSSEGNNASLGDTLIQLLDSRAPFYNQVWLVSAFANQRAVLRLLPYVVRSREDRAQITAVIGIDHRGTSVEALQRLLDFGIDVYVFKNRIPGHTFHPKIYLFEATNHQAELFIGSNNMTDGGLYTNYEASVRLSFRLPTDLAVYNQIKESISRFINPPEANRLVLTNNLIDLLIARREIVFESSRQSPDSEPPDQQPIAADQEETEIPQSPFQSESIPSAPSLAPNLRRTIRLTRPRRTSLPGRPGHAERVLLWRKENLPRSDVQRQTGNVTGGLRLTQAGWQVDGEAIDQTTYFRNTIFSHLHWTTGVNPPRRRETAIISAEVIILGENYGIHDFIVSHKPSGEAGQRNYTTMFHWGELADTIRELNLSGRTFFLYAPLENETEPYRVVID